jgi:simple sugar transport system ATP-binding protein
MKRMSALLEVRDLYKSFGAVDVLKGVNFSLEKGEVLAVVGDNGAGKSTLIKHIAGVYHQDSGEVLLNGDVMEFKSPKDGREAGIETVYQDLALADELSVGANIFLGREPIKKIFGFLPVIDDQTISKETEQLINRIESHIPAKAPNVSGLSGGQRQAVAIARALYWQAKVVILDEPTAALAVMERDNVVKLSKMLAKEGVGVIYVGHNLVEILDVADRVAVMFRGQVVHVTRTEDTTQEELIKYMTGFSETQAA